MKKRSDSYASVWDSLADTTEQAANLRARADQMRQRSRRPSAAASHSHGSTIFCGAESRASCSMGWVNIATALGRPVSIELDAALGAADHPSSAKA